MGLCKMRQHLLLRRPALYTLQCAYVHKQLGRTNVAPEVQCKSVRLRSVGQRNHEMRARTHTYLIADVGLEVRFSVGKLHQRKGILDALSENHITERYRPKGKQESGRSTRHPELAPVSKYKDRPRCSARTAHRDEDGVREKVV